MFADETESVNIAILSMSQRSPTFSNEFRKRQKRYYADHLLLSYIFRYSHCTRTRLEQLTSVVDKSRAGYISRFSRDDNIINKANVRYDPIVIPINEEKLVQTYNRKSSQVSSSHNTVRPGATYALQTGRPTIQERNGVRTTRVFNIKKHLQHMCSILWRA